MIYQDAGAEVFTREKIKATKTRTTKTRTTKTRTTKTRTTKKTKTKKRHLLQKRQEKQENKSYINHT